MPDRTMQRRRSGADRLPRTVLRTGLLLLILAAGAAGCRARDGSDADRDLAGLDPADGGGPHAADASPSMDLAGPGDDLGPRSDLRPVADQGGPADLAGAPDVGLDTALPLCDPALGLTRPIACCTAAAPCTDRPDSLSPEVSEPSTAPVCRTTRDGRPIHDDGPPRHAVDPAGVTRYSCLFAPPGATPAARRPLLVFFHGTFGSAANVYNYTSLRTKAAAFDLAGAPDRRGFVLLAISSRNLDWPAGETEDGAKHDYYHRDLAAPSGNPDLANFDREVDELVAGGLVDPQRIYVSGWSNGGRFAQLVAIARHTRATPGGNRVAAAAIYSGTDPFNNLGREQRPSCALDPYPRSTVPILLVGRACDVLPCDEAQGQGLLEDGLAIEPGDVMATWVEALGRQVGDPHVQRIILAGTGEVTNRCTAPRWCSRVAALLNHLRWPDGIDDGSGEDHEPAMLEFLREHPLP